MCVVETLESRRLMSVAASSALGTLYVYGDDAANGIRISQDFTANGVSLVVRQRVSANVYAKVYEIAPSKINKILVYARGGDDNVDVEFSIKADVTIYGGHGADWIKAGGLKCDIWGDTPTSLAQTPDDNAADTMIDGAQGDCRMWGQGGNDKFYKGAINIVTAQFGQDYMNGGAGNDKFYTTLGSTSRQTLVLAGTGNDTLFARAVDHVSFYGAAGSDTVDFSAASEAVYAHVEGYAWAGSRSNPNRRYTFINGDTENLTGSQYGDDLLEASTSSSVIRGGGGNDSIWGGSGKDTLFGGDGNDTIVGSDGDDWIYGDAGNDSLIGGGGTDHLDGGTGADRFVAKDNTKDYIYGGPDADSLTSSDSIDVLTGVP